VDNFVDKWLLTSPQATTTALSRAERLDVEKNNSNQINDLSNTLKHKPSYFNKFYDQQKILDKCA
jgi:hypothetical protein